MATLRNWKEIIYPNEHAPSLTGQVYGHPRFEDGTTVITSALVIFSPTKDFARTRSGTIYHLGEPLE